MTKFINKHKQIVIEYILQYEIRDSFGKQLKLKSSEISDYVTRLISDKLVNSIEHFNRLACLVKDNKKIPLEPYRCTSHNAASISGFYDYKLYKPSDVILPPPPGLWRQTARCINCNYYGAKPLTCRIVKKRWIKKMTLGRIRTMDIQNFIKRRLPQRSNNSIDYSYSVLYERFSQERLLEHDKYWSGTLCACNNKPAKIIINYKSRYNHLKMCKPSFLFYHYILRYHKGKKLSNMYNLQHLILFHILLDL